MKNENHKRQIIDMRTWQIIGLIAFLIICISCIHFWRLGVIKWWFAIFAIIMSTSIYSTNIAIGGIIFNLYQHQPIMYFIIYIILAFFVSCGLQAKKIIFSEDKKQDNHEIPDNIKQIILNFENLISKNNFNESSLNLVSVIPYDSFSDLLSDLEENKISILTIFNGNIIQLLATKFEFIIILMIFFVPIIISIGFFIYSIYTFSLIFLIPILFIIIGFFMSSPGAKGCSTIIFLLVWILLYSKFQAVRFSSIGFYIGILSGYFIRQFSHLIFKKRAILSEKVFCFLFVNNIIAIKNSIDNEIIISDKPLNPIFFRP